MTDVLVEERDHVAWITLNRPDVRNALSRAVNLRLQEIADRARARREDLARS